MYHAPIWQLGPRIRARIEVIEKLVDRAADVYNGKLSRRVRGAPKAA